MTQTSEHVSRATDDFVYQPPLQPYLTLVYYDNDIVVADKASGLLSVPGKAVAHQDSLERRLHRVWPEIRVVHRLDMATSGLILFALHKQAQSELSKQFQRRTVAKRYYARVAGQLPQHKGEVDLPLRCDWPNRPKQMVCADQGKSSLTGYEVLNYNATLDVSDVILSPVTGRSHQLRVHMNALGCPILGDRLYGTETSRAGSQRLLLHAQSIEFTHPITGQPQAFTLSAPF